ARDISSGGTADRSYPSRHQRGRFAGPALAETRARGQPQGRGRARAHRAARPHRPRRRVDPLSLRRRDVLAGLAGAAILPRTMRARPAGRMPRIGVLLLFAAGDPEAQVRIRVLGQALQEHGWKDGENVIVEYRFAAGDFDRMRAFAQEMATLRA